MKTTQAEEKTGSKVWVDGQIGTWKTQTDGELANEVTFHAAKLLGYVSELTIRVNNLRSGYDESCKLRMDLQVKLDASRVEADALREELGRLALQQEKIGKEKSNLESEIKSWAAANHELRLELISMKRKLARRAR